MPREIVFTEKAAKPPAAYSQAVKAARLTVAPLRGLCRVHRYGHQTLLSPRGESS
jgi:hypothetical protein